MPVATAHAPAPQAPAREAVPPAPPTSFAALLPEDPALRINLSPNAATMSIQTPDLGDLSLYLRVRQGAAELRVDGAAGPQIERHAEGLRAALAAEGIALHRLEVRTAVSAAGEASGSTSSTTQFEQDRPPPQQPDQRPEPSLRAAPSSSASSPARLEAGLHICA
jgi:hypothetical protein